MPCMAPPRDRVSLAGRRVLVTGARGFLGSHLMLALAASGADAHAFQGDITDGEAVRAEVSDIGPDLVFHMAAYGTTPIQRDEARMREVNVGGTKHLWEALDRQPCRVVQTGTCGEYGPAMGALAEDHLCRPATAYTRTMHEAVLFSLDRARHSGRELIVLRPFGPYGPDDRSERLVPHVIDGLLSGGRVATTSGQQRRDHSHENDRRPAGGVQCRHGPPDPRAGPDRDDRHRHRRRRARTRRFRRRAAASERSVRHVRRYDGRPAA